MKLHEFFESTNSDETKFKMLVPNIDRPAPTLQGELLRAADFIRSLAVYNDPDETNFSGAATFISNNFDNFETDNPAEDQSIWNVVERLEADSNIGRIADGIKKDAETLFAWLLKVKPSEGTPIKNTKNFSNLQHQDAVIDDDDY